ncbi:MAG: methyltransferase [Verrucomicrobia bacterium]|nr:methyltransferase [Verrucomicrobiota bacterium]
MDRAQPDRPPRHTWFLPIAEREHGAAAIRDFKARWPDDFGTPNVAIPAVEALRQGDIYAAGTYVDEWGCEFLNLQAGVIGEVKEPLISDWPRLDDLRLPEACLQVDRAAVNAACRASGQFLISDGFPRPFERLQFLRGTENVYLDLAAESPELRELLHRIHGHYCRELVLWARTDVDGLVFIDDWGSQNRLLIRPEMWRRWFKPLYLDYVNIAHSAGKKIFMHSDGHIAAIYQDLVEIGVDAINSQLFCMDLEDIGTRFQGRIAFWGEIDRQHILPFGTTDEVRAAVRRLAEATYDPSGGVIAQFEFGPGCKLENAHAVHEEWAHIADGSGAGWLSQAVKSA